MKKKVKIIPQNDRILVESIKVSSTTKSGIIIDVNEDKIETAFARIVKVSNELKDDYKAKEIIYHNPQAGVNISLYGKKYLLLTRGEILAKIELDERQAEAAFQDVSNLI